MSTFAFPSLTVPKASPSPSTTHFSFDESVISPHFASSPSLSGRPLSLRSNATSNRSSTSSNGNSNTSSLNRDVVEAVTELQNGCLAILLQSQTSSQTHTFEWAHTRVDKALQHIQTSSDALHRIDIANIASVHKLDTAEANTVHKRLGIDGVSLTGLQSLALRFTFKSKSPIVLVFDESRSAYIWKRALADLRRSLSRGYPTTTIAFCCSPLDRVNNEEQFLAMELGANAWIEGIAQRLSAVDAHITRVLCFAQRACILDSSEHTSLLLRARSLKALHSDAQRLSGMCALDREEKHSLREVWLSLLSDLSVALLTEHGLRCDMKASTSMQL